MAIFQIALTRPYGLDLGAGELYAALDGLEHVIFVASATVVRYHFLCGLFAAGFCTLFSH